MKIEKIEFAGSSPSVKQCPGDGLPEFAFIGRSNVGKSSLINLLTGHKGLAKVSGMPGKTRLINHFKIQSSSGGSSTETLNTGSNTGDPGSRKRSSASWFLVDLPGYGFAKLPKHQRAKIEEMIRSYFNRSEHLALTFLLIDSRLEPQKSDLEFMNWLGDQELGFVVLFTKCDKLTRSQLASSMKAYQKALSESWSELPLIIPTSAESRLGKDDVLETIEKALSEIMDDPGHG
jgi:GTP-binding protein